MKAKIIVLMVAIMTALGIVTAAPASASTGYRTNTCTVGIFGFKSQWNERVSWDNYTYYSQIGSGNLDPGVEYQRVTLRIHAYNSAGTLVGWAGQDNVTIGAIHTLRLNVGAYKHPTRFVFSADVTNDGMSGCVRTIYVY